VQNKGGMGFAKSNQGKGNLYKEILRNEAKPMPPLHRTTGLIRRCAKWLDKQPLRISPKRCAK